MKYTDSTVILECHRNYKRNNLEFKVDLICVRFEFVLEKYRNLFLRDLADHDIYYLDE